MCVVAPDHVGAGSRWSGPKSVLSRDFFPRDRRAPVSRGPRLALPFGTGQIHQVELADPNVVASVVALTALHHDAEDRVTSRRGQVHHRRPHGPILFASLLSGRHWFWRNQAKRSGLGRG